MEEITARIRKIWWIVLVVGILAVMLGMHFMTHPLAAFETISLYIALYFLITGIVSFVTVLGSKGAPNWGISMVTSAIALIAGILLVFKPGVSEMFLIVITGVGLLSEAITMIAGAIALKQLGGSAWPISLILGIIFLIFALMVVGRPFISFLLITTLVAISVLIFGVQLILISIQMKRL